MKRTIEVAMAYPSGDETWMMRGVEADVYGLWAVHGERGHWRVTHAPTGFLLTRCERKADAVDLCRRMRDAGFDPEQPPTEADREAWTQILDAWIEDRALEEGYDSESWWRHSSGPWCPTEDSPR